MESMESMESIEILKERLEKRLRDLYTLRDYQKALEIRQVIDVFIPESVAKAKDVEKETKPLIINIEMECPQCRKKWLWESGRKQNWVCPHCHYGEKNTGLNILTAFLDWGKIDARV